MPANNNRAAPESKSGCIEDGGYSVRDIQRRQKANERLRAEHLGESADYLAHWALDEEAVEAVRDQAAIER